MGNGDKRYRWNRNNSAKLENHFYSRFFDTFWWFTFLFFLTAKHKTTIKKVKRVKDIATLTVSRTDADDLFIQFASPMSNFLAYLWGIKY